MVCINLYAEKPWAADDAKETFNLYTAFYSTLIKIPSGVFS